MVEVSFVVKETGIPGENSWAAEVTDKLSFIKMVNKGKAVSPRYGLGIE